MNIPQIILLALAIILGILAVVFHRSVLNVLVKIWDSFSDFLLSFKYGNFTEREETVSNIYLNYHYPVYSPYNAKCFRCGGKVTSQDSPRCPVCGIYICMNCGSCHRDCFDRDNKIFVAEKEVNAILRGKKKKAMNNRIEAIKSRSNDKTYYCELIDKD